MTTILLTDKVEAVSYVEDGKGVTEDMVDVEYDVSKYNMKSTEETRNMIEGIWSKRTQENSRLYNATKFRLASHSWDSDNKQRVVMKVGLTDYKDHVGTNLSLDVAKYIGTGDTKFDLMSQCIGVGVWAVTSDNKVIFVENAGWKGEQGGKIDRPGGHAEPAECGQDNLDSLPGDTVRAELFDCIRRELRDEVNIGLELQEPPELLGVVYNHECGGRLSLDFLINVKVTSEEVLRLYKQGGLETDESTDLFFIPVDQVSSLDPEFSSKFTPHCSAGIHLFRRRLSLDK